MSCIYDKGLLIEKVKAKILTLDHTTPFDTQAWYDSAVSTLATLLYPRRWDAGREPPDEQYNYEFRRSPMLKWLAISMADNEVVQNGVATAVANDNFWNSNFNSSNTKRLVNGSLFQLKHYELIPYAPLESRSGIYSKIDKTPDNVPVPNSYLYQCGVNGYVKPYVEHNWYNNANGDVSLAVLGQTSAELVCPFFTDAQTWVDAWSLGFTQIIYHHGIESVKRYVSQFDADQIDTNALIMDNITDPVNMEQNGLTQYTGGWIGALPNAKHFVGTLRWSKR